MNTAIPRRPALSVRGLQQAPAVWSGNSAPRARRRVLVAPRPRRSRLRTLFQVAAVLLLALVVRTGPHPYAEVQALVPPPIPDSVPAVAPVVAPPPVALQPAPLIEVAVAKPVPPPSRPHAKPVQPRRPPVLVAQARPMAPPAYPPPPAELASTHYAPRNSAPSQAPAAAPRGTFDPFAASTGFDPFH